MRRLRDITRHTMLGRADHLRLLLKICNLKTTASVCIPSEQAVHRKQSDSLKIRAFLMRRNILASKVYGRQTRQAFNLAERVDCKTCRTVL